MYVVEATYGIQCTGSKHIYSPLWTLRLEERRLPPKRAPDPLPTYLHTSLPHCQPSSALVPDHVSVVLDIWSCAYCALSIYLLCIIVYGPANKTEAQCKTFLRTIPSLSVCGKAINLGTCTKNKCPILNIIRLICLF